MPQLDHYNFTLPYFCFAILFLLTVIMLGTVYLPMLYRHQKVTEFHLKELLARNKIAIIEKELLIKAREATIIKVLKKK